MEGSSKRLGFKCFAFASVILLILSVAQYRAFPSIRSAFAQNEPDFSVSANPTSVSFNPPGPGNSTITVSPINGFNEPVALTVTSDSQIRCTLSVGTINPPGGTSTLSCTSTTLSPPSYNANVTATSGALSHLVTVSFSIVPRGQIDPATLSDPSIPIGTSETFKFNTTFTPPINGFSIVVDYDPTILDALSVNFDVGILSGTGSQINEITNCIDGTGQCRGVAGADFSAGHILLSLTVNNANTTSTSGVLFTATFNVTGIGSTQIHIRKVLFANGHVSIKPTSSDAFFANIDCRGNPCEPPTSIFTWSPAVVHQRDLVTFNATESHGPGQNVNITRYLWDWGDNSGTSEFCDIGCKSANHSPLNATAQHIFQIECFPCAVTLTVTDTDGVSWSTTIGVTVFRFLIQLSVTDVLVNPSAVNVNPGIVITFTGLFKNSGTITLNATFHIILEVTQGSNKTLSEASFMNVKFSTTRTLNATWDTTGYVPKVYRIDAYVDRVVNETDTSQNLRAAWVQLVEPFSAGISPSLLTTTGIGILVVLGGGFAVSQVRRRRRPVENPPDL